ncbi:hypothetical protein U1Q18_017146 [Sarracenia purpurea var. burkii]
MQHQHRSSDHQAKHRRRDDTGDRVAPPRCESMPHKLIDAPPYSDIYLTARGFVALRPEVREKVRVVEFYDRREDGVYKEDIDAEADEFIKREHERFKITKWLSIDDG